MFYFIRCGSASHLGVVENVPTIGVAKHLLHLPGLDERNVKREAARVLEGDVATWA